MVKRNPDFPFEPKKKFQEPAENMARSRNFLQDREKQLHLSLPFQCCFWKNELNRILPQSQLSFDVNTFNPCIRDRDDDPGIKRIEFYRILRDPVPVHRIL